MTLLGATLSVELVDLTTVKFYRQLEITCINDESCFGFDTGGEIRLANDNGALVRVANDLLFYRSA